MIRMRNLCAVLAVALSQLLAPQALMAAAGHNAGDASAERCEALSGLRLADTTIAMARFIPEQPATSTANGTKDGHRAYCRVVAHVRSDPDSNIGVEIWLPAEGWTGVFHGNGSGGFAGTFVTGYSGMVDGLRRGFATATTDTGTTPASPLEGDVLAGHPRKWRDWARLSTHVMTVTGKAIAKAYYGRDAKRSLYTGCSTGGQQGLIEALYHPDDYDGILVGAPVINRTWGHAAVLWDYAAAYRTPGSRLSAAKLKLLNQAAIATCWRQGHGVAGDPFVSDPLSCRFDPAILACREEDSDDCLTDAEVTTARAFYSGPISRSGKPNYYGWLPGSEAPNAFDWSFLQRPINDQPPFAGLFKWVFGPRWDWRSFALERDMPVVDAKLDGIVNDATRGSLRAFAARGGKLIMFHGLADTLVAPGQSVDFFERHASEIGRAVMSDAARLYLIPGVAHCGGGPGPDSVNATLGIPPSPPSEDASHDLFSSLIAWTNDGSAPERIVATKFMPDEPGRIQLQRPICPFPKKAHYRGAGSTKVAANFECR